MGIGNGTGSMVIGAALLAAGCSGSSEGWLDDADAYESGYYDGYEDGQGDAEPSLAEILVGGAVLLWGDGGGGGGGGGRVPWRRGRNDLVRPHGSTDPDDRGFVELLASAREERFRIRARGLRPDGVHEVVLVDAAGLEGVVDWMIAGWDGRAAIDLSSRSWAALPGQSASVADLAGIPLEVRDEAGEVVLRGRVPSLHARGSRRATARARDGATGASGRARLRGSARSGRRVAEVALAGVGGGEEALLLGEDRDGNPVPCGRTTAGPGGRCRFRFDSHRGDPLPGGAGDLFDLAGRSWEVRAGGDVILAGRFPVL